DHARRAEDLHVLGGILAAQGKNAEAEQCYRSALLLCRQETNRLRDDVLDDLASVLQGQKRYAEAQQLRSEALDLRRKWFGSEHPSVASSLNNIGALLADQGKLAEAGSHFLQALELRRKLLPPNHPDVILSVKNLALIWEHQDRWKEVETLLREILKQQIPASSRPELLHELARTLIGLSDFKEAEKCCREELAILFRQPDADSQLKLWARSLLRQALLGQELYPEAEVLAREHLAD